MNATYPICPVCKTFQCVYDDELTKHLKEVHGINPQSNKPVDYKEGLKALQVKEAELSNKEKELAQWEKEITEREAALKAAPAKAPRAAKATE